MSMIELNAVTVDLTVDELFDAMDEGARQHMVNKLVKHGYQSPKAALEPTSAQLRELPISRLLEAIERQVFDLQQQKIYADNKVALLVAEKDRR